MGWRYSIPDMPDPTEGFIQVGEGPKVPDTTEEQKPTLTWEEKKQKMAAEKREHTRKKKDEAENAVYKLDKEQKDHIVSYLLKQSAERRLMVVEEVLETWTSTLTDDYLRFESKIRRRVDYRRQLERVREYFGTNFEREGQPRFRQARLSTVVASLIKFCLSAGARDTSKEADLGLFAETADEKTGTALLGLAPVGQGVAITEAGYNQTQMLLRKIQETFGSEMLDGRPLMELVEEARDGLKQIGKAGPIYSDEKGLKTYKERVAAKRRKMTDEERDAYDDKVMKAKAQAR